MTNPDTTETAIAAAAAKASYASSMLTVLAGLSIGDWAALIGIGATLATFAANLWFRVRADRREQHEHDAKMEARRHRRALSKAKKADNQQNGE